MADQVAGKQAAAVTQPEAATGTLLMQPIDGGLRIKHIGPYYVDVLTMLFTYRLVATPVDCPFVYDRFYCYAGENRAEVFMTAALAAMAWDPTDGSEPAGWNKNGQTGEWRAPADG